MLLLAAGLLALAAPGVAGTWLPGLPLTAVGLVAVGLVMFAAVGLPLPRPRVALALTAVLLLLAGSRAAVGMLTPQAGLLASYWANDQFSGPVERSTDFTSLQGATRLDSALDLQGNHFPVAFVNDSYRFNFGPDHVPARDQLPFSVRWQASLRVDAAGSHTFQLQSEGPAAVWLDGTQLLATHGVDGVNTQSGAVDLSVGWHTLRVDYVRPANRVPDLQLTWAPEPGSALQPVGGTWVEPHPVEQPALQPAIGARIGQALAVLTLLTLAIWLGLGVLLLRRAPRATIVRAGLAGMPLLFLLYGLALNASLIGRTVVLSGLDDWLTYEGYARDILLNGPLMTNGADHAAAYYAQPLYPYVLAVAHLLTGESIAGPLVLQYAALGLLLSLTAILAADLFGPMGGVAAFAAFAWFLQVEHLGVAGQLFNENLYQPLVLVCLLALVRLARRPRPPAWWASLLAGVLIGVTAVAREQVLLFVPCAFAILLLGWWRAGARLRGVAALVLLSLGIMAAIAPVTARNLVVSGQTVLIASSGGASLLGNGVHVPPASFDRSHLADDPLYNALKLDGDTRLVVDFARHDPLGYLSTWLPGLAHAVGIPGIRQHAPSMVWGIVLAVAAYLLALVWVPAARRREAWLLHAFIGTHLLTLMVFEADTYGYRLAAPMYAPLVAVAAQMLPLAARTLRGAVGHPVHVSRPAFGLAALALVGVGAFARQGVDLATNWSQRELQLSGLRGPDAWAVADAEAAGADVVYLASIDGTPRTVSAGFLPGLRFPRLKWFDPSLTLPLAPTGTHAAFQLQELLGHDARQWGLASCLGQPGADGVVVLSAADEMARCAPTDPPLKPLNARFGGTALVQEVAVSPTVEAGASLPVYLLWQPLQPAPPALETFVHVVDPTLGAFDPITWGNGTRALYPAAEWDPSERLLSRLQVQTEGTALPGSYHLQLGMAPTGRGAASLHATWPGGDDATAPIGSVALSLGQPAAFTLPPDMLSLAQPVTGGGLQLLAVQQPPAQVQPGQMLQLGLLWKSLGATAPAAQRVRFQLLTAGGEVVQDSVAPLLGGRIPPGSLPDGAAVRDQEHLQMSPRLPAGTLSLRITLLDSLGNAISEGASEPRGSVLTLKVQSRPRFFALPANVVPRIHADFGSQVELASSRVNPSSVKPGGTTTIQLVWRALADMGTNYTVFVHVLDAGQQHVLAQRDAQPQDGQSPTSSWDKDEVVEDSYELSIPADVAAGAYPVEVGLYDPATGQRLLLPNGQSRVILPTRLHVAG